MKFVPIFLLGLMLAEIAVFVWIGSIVGALAVVLAVVVSGIAGMALIRRQGLKTLNRLRSAMEGRAPASATPGSGVFTVTAGLLLILPGFISDAVALTLLLPPVRKFLAGRLSRHFVFETRSSYRAPSGHVIDAEAVEIVEEPRRFPPNSDSPWRQ